MECYLDNSATTRCLDSAAALMAGILCTDYGNPSSLHHKGVQAEEYVRHAREVIAKTLKVTPKEIFFTSGGTESDNLALRGAAYANARQGKHLITTSIEHPAILNTMQYLEQQGFEVTYLPVDENGKIRLSDLEAAIRPDTILVSIMHTNNGLRSGTENVPAIAGMGKAAEEMYQNLDTDLDRMYALKQRLADGISTMENVRINGLCGRDSAPHVLSVSFAGVRSEVLLHALEEREIYVSAGSACASNHPDTSGSATLRAIGLPKELLNSTIRFSLSVFTTEEEIDYTVQVLHELVPMLRRFTRR